MLTMTKAVPLWRITAPRSCTSPNIELTSSSSMTRSGKAAAVPAPHFAIPTGRHRHCRAELASASCPG